MNSLNKNNFEPIKFDQRWLTNTTGNLNAPWYERLEGDDRKNAELWILQNQKLFTLPQLSKSKP
jgi:hypothetical protein